MKNVFKVFGIIALLAVIGFSTSACDNGGGGGSGLVGKWEDNTTHGVTITFTTTRYELKGGDTVVYSGTYEFNSSTGKGIMHEEEGDMPFTLSDGLLTIDRLHYRFKKK